MEVDPVGALLNVPTFSVVSNNSTAPKIHGCTVSRGRCPDPSHSRLSSPLPQDIGLCVDMDDRSFEIGETAGELI